MPYWLIYDKSKQKLISVWTVYPKEFAEDTDKYIVIEYPDFEDD